MVKVFNTLSYLTGIACLLGLQVHIQTGKKFNYITLQYISIVNNEMIIPIRTVFGVQFSFSSPDCSSF
jgi:hypothetical protein